MGVLRVTGLAIGAAVRSRPIGRKGRVGRRRARVGLTGVNAESTQPDSASSTPSFRSIGSGSLPRGGAGERQSRGAGRRYLVPGGGQEGVTGFGQVAVFRCVQLTS